MINDNTTSSSSKETINDELKNALSNVNRVDKQISSYDKQVK